MSLTGIGFLGSDTEEELHPQFTRVLKGFDTEEVEAYSRQMASRIESLEQALEEMREQRDSAQRRYASVKEEAYRQAAARMADVLRAADQQAEKIRRESEEEATQRVADAIQQAEQIRLQAEADAHRMRHDAEKSMTLAQTEVERVLGGLAARREAMIADMMVIKDRISALFGQVESTITLSMAQDIVDLSKHQQAGQESSDHTDEDSDKEALLELPEGFDLVLPDILPVEDEE